MIDDKELEEMQQMEIAYKKACELHLQYEKFVILKRLSFQGNCPHTETRTEVKEIFVTDLGSLDRRLLYCKRCGKLIRHLGFKEK